VGQTRDKVDDEAPQPKVWPWRLQSGAKPHRKRTVQVAVVYRVEPYGIIGDMASVRLVVQGEMLVDVEGPANDDGSSGWS
jgi:hypothetical protein